MSGFYNSSPWSGAGGAAEQIGDSLRRLTATMAQRQMTQRYQQQRMALMQQAQQQRGQLEQAQIGTQHAQAGFDNSRTQHQQSVDNAARDYQAATVARSNGPGFMQDGPTIANANQLDIGRELGVRALVRGLGGNVDNPPTAAINPGQERINTLTGQSMGYLPPNPTFHAVPAGGTPFIFNGQDQANQAGPQTGFSPRQLPRPAVPTFHPGTDTASPIVFDPVRGIITPVLQSKTGMSLGPSLQITNLLSRAFNSSPDNQTNQSQRIRVQGPNGETGTMDSSEQLPAGWKPIQ